MAEIAIAETGLIGTRVRERRLALAMKQTDLAHAAEISPSYLNLIEHNRRRIGGSLVLRLARALGVEPGLLIQGAAAGLVAGVQAAAQDHPELALDPEEAAELAERFPGWAELITADRARLAEMSEQVQMLMDRLAHDPDLAGRLHEVLSMVTAVRSSASILMETPELEPEWQHRFHRNINEDSARLAQGAEALVAYLDAPVGRAGQIQTPLDEVEAFWSDHGHHFGEVERRGAEVVTDLVAESELLASEQAREMARQRLEVYARDATAMPMDDLAEAVEEVGVDPLRLAARLAVPVAQVMRRLPHLPEELCGELGYLSCDGSGSILSRRAIAGFAMPRGAGGCPLWPLYRALGQPGTLMRVPLLQAGQDARHLLAFAHCEITEAAQYGQPALRRAQMILVPATGGDVPASEEVTEVGLTCRVCPVADCAARREPSLVQINANSASAKEF
ncbi:short-chain fatty acyl-CoA regulator family protein [Roseovarius sp. C7]|uniref:short-chain fatty acyl-CoA regulator family protein n=1 Tax=Roseovarius sp. C7 TaxID=3398643 RepID=UPI0039F721D8